MMRSYLSILLLSVCCSLAVAMDTYEFASAELQQRFNALNTELRCPKCQNQNLAGSNAPIAIDLRAQVYRLLNEGKSDREIKSYLVDRYGEYVLYRPQWSPQTYALWLAPVLFVAVGLVLVVLLVRRTRGAAASVPRELSDADRKRLDDVLGTSSDITPEDQERD